MLYSKYTINKQPKRQKSVPKNPPRYGLLKDALNHALVDRLAGLKL